MGTPPPLICPQRERDHRRRAYWGRRRDSARRTCRRGRLHRSRARSDQRRPPRHDSDGQSGNAHMSQTWIDRRARVQVFNDADLRKQARSLGAPAPRGFRDPGPAVCASKILQRREDRIAGVPRCLHPRGACSDHEPDGAMYKPPRPLRPVRVVYDLCVASPRPKVLSAVAGRRDELITNQSICYSVASSTRLLLQNARISSIGMSISDRSLANG